MIRQHNSLRILLDTLWEKTLTCEAIGAVDPDVSILSSPFPKGFFMAEDVREKASLNHEAVISLNFIRDSSIYVFRRHYRQGLRSHIMEVLKRMDVVQERTGIEIDGVKWFPRAKPTRMLRIFRTKFKRLEEAIAEIGTVKIIEKYLGPNHIAVSDEFLVDYMVKGRRDFLLCGLQEYVEGEVLDPWGSITRAHLAGLLGRMNKESGNRSETSEELWIQRVRVGVERFIESVKRMILDAGHVPDLAGVGNILLTPAGDVKLVDINNVSKVSFESRIEVDDKGYPVCDTSIKALSMLEQKALERSIDMKETIYRTFLDAQRMKEVRILQEQFDSFVTCR